MSHGYSAPSAVSPTTRSVRHRALHSIARIPPSILICTMTGYGAVRRAVAVPAAALLIMYSAVRPAVRRSARLVYHTPIPRISTVANVSDPAFTASRVLPN